MRKYLRTHAFYLKFSYTFQNSGFRFYIVSSFPVFKTPFSTDFLWSMKLTVQFLGKEVSHMTIKSPSWKLHLTQYPGEQL